MKSIKLITRTDYRFLQYYHNYDVLNKYILKSLYKKPLLKSIVLELSLAKIADSFLTKFQYNTETIQILGFLIFYILFTFLPFINFSKSNSAELNIKNNYALKVIISKQSQIYNFLHDISSYLNFDFTKEKNLKIGFNNNFIVTQFYNADNFFELESFLNKYVKHINIKELNFYLRFNFIYENKLNSHENFIRNFPFLNK
jgi:hypothetical protein